MLKRAAALDPKEAIDVKLVDGYPWITARGQINTEVGDAVFARAAQLVASQGASRLVLDFRSAALVEDSLALLRRVRAMDAQPALRAVRTAVICAARSNAYAFLEGIANQHGHEFRVFTDSVQAMDWLNSAG